MKKQNVIALYSLVFAFAFPVYLEVRDAHFGWAWPAPIFLWSSVGLYLKKKWAPPLTFGLYGICLLLTMVSGLLLLVLGCLQAYVDQTIDSMDSFWAESLDLFQSYLPTYLTICLLLYIPLRLMGSKEIKETFGIKQNDLKTKHPPPDKEQV